MCLLFERLLLKRGTGNRNERREEKKIGTIRVTCKSFWRVCDFDSVFLTIKKIKERFLRLNPTVYNLKLHKSDKNSRNLPRWPITDLPTMCLSLLYFCSLIITAHKALDFKLISIEFFFFPMLWAPALGVINGHLKLASARQFAFARNRT